MAARDWADFGPRVNPGECGDVIGRCAVPFYHRLREGIPTLSQHGCHIDEAVGNVAAEAKNETQREKVSGSVARFFAEHAGFNTVCCDQCFGIYCAECA